MLLDSEGLDVFGEEGFDDYQIFTLSVLLSSVLIYNSVVVPVRENLDRLKYPFAQQLYRQLIK